ncbi:MAG: hypothetical protein M3N53_10510 [Actinomycetota bacterium]|nr:hypothetical protein [Actinomycetota bacterium]
MVAAVAVACALSLAATLPEAPASAQPPVAEGDRAAIQALLDRRALAILDGDRAAFMSTVGGWSEDFVARQKTLFRGLQDVPLSSFRYRLAWERRGDLVRRSDVRRYPGAERVSIPLTEERYRIEGFDRREAVEDLYYTYVKQNDEWLIAEDTDLDDLTLYSARHLWDFGALETERSEHFLMFSHPCRNCDRLGDDFLSLAEQGLARARRYWQGPWNERIVVLVPRSGKQLERMIQSTFDLDNFVAFAYSTVDGTDGVDYTGHRIIPNPRAFSGRASESVLQILAHELLHVATRDSAGPFVPVFVDEGFADYVGHDAAPGALAFFNSDVAAGLFNGELPEDFEFTIGGGTEIYRSYQKSQSAIRYFIDRFGLTAFNRFYRRLGRVEIAAGTARFHIDRALRATTGIGYTAFQEAWTSSIGA